MAKKEELTIEEKLQAALISKEEQPYEIPDSWVWVRLGEISKIISKGTTPRGGNTAYTDIGVKFLRVENISNNCLDLSNVKFIDEYTHLHFLKRSILKINDILISIAGTLGKTAIILEENLPLNINQAIAFIRLLRENRKSSLFISNYFKSPLASELLLKKSKITAVPNLTLEAISSSFIPLPPLEEQQEIVRVLEEVLEKEKKVKELIDLEEKIDLLEKSILDKAFLGKLGTQDKNDEPALELLKKIIERKEQIK